jgi:predicted MPP superfamily phosphohydrolase
MLVGVLVAAAHAALGLALWGPLGPTTAGMLTLVLWVVTAQRVQALFRYRPPLRRVTHWVDLPVLCHAAAALGALFAAGFGAMTGLGAARFGALGYLATLPLAAWSIWGKPRTLRVRSTTVPGSWLGPSFARYRIVQLSDLHLGPFHPLPQVLGWVHAANRVAADLCVVTGDLMARGSGSASEVVTAVSALRARDGVLVVLGNHDQEEADWLTRALRERGVTVLRNQWHRIDRRGDELWVLGLDDWRTIPRELEELLGSRPGGPPFLLLAHRYDRKVAYGQLGLGLFGHTHGGQIGLPWVDRWVNLVTLTGQRAQGCFRLGPGWGYLSAGLGTSGPPMRFGVAPEIAVLVLSEGTASIR